MDIKLSYQFTIQILYYISILIILKVMNAIVLIVEKNGNIKEQTIKNFQEEELYKKAGFKTPEDFSCKTTWKVEVSKKQYSINLYGKTTGRANQENKYEFPPTVDNTLFFGGCILLNTVDYKLSVNEWEAIYEKLYGGFDDLEEDNDDDDEEDDEDVKGLKTSSGYVKDGFVVGDSDEEENEDEEDEEYEDEDEDEDGYYAKKAKKSTSKNAKKNVQKTTPIEIVEIEPDEYFNVASELKEEEYED